MGAQQAEHWGESTAVCLVMLWVVPLGKGQVEYLGLRLVGLMVEQSVAGWAEGLVERSAVYLVD